jgi:hypothetical protein
VIGTQAGRLVVGVAHPEEGRLPPTGLPLGGDQAAGVVLVRLCPVQIQAADRVDEVEHVLEAEWDRLRVADQQQVIGHSLRVGGLPGHDLVADQEVHDRLAGLVAVRAPVLPVVALLYRGRLPAAMLQQRQQRFPDGRVGAVGEDDAPAGLAHIRRVGVDDGEEAPCDRLVAALELTTVLRVQLLSPGQRRADGRAERGQQIAAGGTVHAVDLNHRCPIPPMRRS